MHLKKFVYVKQETNYAIRMGRVFIKTISYRSRNLSGKGTIYALDIDPDMIRMTSEEAKKQGLDNVRTMLHDFMTEGSGLADGSVDYVMLFNILHLENPRPLLKEALRILKQEGKLGIIHWNYDPKTPRGPSMDIRPKSEQCIQWAKSVGFFKPIRHDLRPYLYGIVFKKAVK